MHDPYLYEKSNVLKNKLGIKIKEELDNAEADYTVYRLKDLVINPLQGEYNTEHFFKVHHFLFQDLFEWAGKPRKIAICKEEDVLGGMSVEYAEPLDIEKDIQFILSDMKQKPWKEMDRKQASIEFSNSLARIWKVHPFREGNTRVTITFCCQYAEKIGLRINRNLLGQNSRYVRNALVAYNAYFSDGSDFSKKEYLERIVYDAME